MFLYPRLPRLKGSLEDEQHLKAASLPCPGPQSEKNAAEKMNDKLSGGRRRTMSPLQSRKGKLYATGRQLTITGHLLYTGGLGRARGLYLSRVPNTAGQAVLPTFCRRRNKPGGVM